MNRSELTYVVIIPAKNEAANIADTLEAVASQTIPPELCLVVDDGSDDETQEIVERFAARHSFVSLINKPGSDKYILGGHVVEVFEYGRAEINARGIDYDYIVKLDADLRFENDHVEQIFSAMSDDKWAIVSGTPYLLVDNHKSFNFSPNWHSHGQFKFYNREFLEQIGSLPKSLGWDCADNIIAISLGWKTAAHKHIHYQMFREVGGKFNLAQGRTKHGIGSYVLGYSPFYFLLRVSHDVLKKPVFFGAISMLKGYLQAMLERRTKILTPPQRKLLRKLLWKDLFRRFKNSEFDVQQKIVTPPVVRTNNKN